MNFNPVRRGEVYCSPSCGYGCTFKQYTDRHAFGKEIADRLGDGWSYHVWENLGWHVSWANGPVKLSFMLLGDEIEWHAMIGANNKQTSHGYSLFSQCGKDGIWDKTPEEAVARAVAFAREQYKKNIKPIIDAIEERYG